MSNSRVCHPPQSSWYDRTKSYQPFESVDACLASGGRLPKSIAHLAQSASANHKVAPMRNYSRSAFGHGWDDSDGDCQDSRAEALISASSTPVRFATGRSEEHTSELQSRPHLVCRLLLEKKKEAIHSHGGTRASLRL